MGAAAVRTLDCGPLEFGRYLQFGAAIAGN
ncbi:MAG: hypothetical protein E3J81_06235, partial [Dehalococcoidia bacterium]